MECNYLRNRRRACSRLRREQAKQIVPQAGPLLGAAVMYPAPGSAKWSASVACTRRSCEKLIIGKSGDWPGSCCWYVYYGAGSSLQSGAKEAKRDSKRRTLRCAVCQGALAAPFASRHVTFQADRPNIPRNTWTSARVCGQPAMKTLSYSF